MIGSGSTIAVKYKMKGRWIYKDTLITEDCFIFFVSVQLFVGSAWSFVFFIPATTANDLRLRWIFYPIFHPLHLLS